MASRGKKMVQLATENSSEKEEEGTSNYSNNSFKKHEEKTHTSLEPVVLCISRNTDEDSDDSIADRDFRPNFEEDVDSSDTDSHLSLEPALKRRRATVVIEEIETQKERGTEIDNKPDENEDNVLAPTAAQGGNRKINRKIQRDLKIQGLEYVNRKKQTIPAKECSIIEACCRAKCHTFCPPTIQKQLFGSFHKLTKEAQEQILFDGISLTQKKTERKGRSKTGREHFRDITATYQIKINNKLVKVCKKIFQCVYGLSRGKVDVLVMKVKACNGSSLPLGDMRGRHEPKNKMTKQREAMKEHIEKYPKYDSHYTRRDTSKKYLSSYLNMKKIYEEYKHDCDLSGRTDCGSYSMFTEEFRKTGYKFKQPKTDTCKTCDSFVLNLKQCKNPEEKAKFQSDYETHTKLADDGYEQKRLDKESCIRDADKIVLVFDLQQVLATPSLTANISFYKRLLSTYNLTIRDCSEKGGTECYMWHEAIGGRGSEQIASCLFKKLQGIAGSVSHVITYSDTCGGQNRNINMAIMFSYVATSHKNISIIDQKFLLPGHTHLECDADHARIERAKKSYNVPIMVPRDWYTFVASVRGKKPFKVEKMTQKDFISFSGFLASRLVKRNLDTENKKINWLHIRWLRYEREFGVIKFKCSLSENEPFRILDLRRSRQSRSNRLGKSQLDNITLPSCSYNAPLPINPLKKKDLISLIKEKLIDEDCHTFYYNLRTSEEAPELGFLEDESDPNEEDH